MQAFALLEMFWPCCPTTTPPCSTRHNQREDLTILPQYIPTKGFRRLPCGEAAETLCEKLRKPYDMVNQQVIRRSQCGHPKNQLDINPDGSCAKARAGTVHTQFFGCNMPYPKQQDTGAPIRDNEGGPSNSQDPMDFAGQYSARVGIGRPKMLAGGSITASVWKQPSDYAELQTEQNPTNATFPIRSAHAAAAGSARGSNTQSDERCKAVLFGEDTTVMGETYPKNDPPTSGAADTMYQAKTISRYHMNGTAQFHKTFGPLDTVNKAMARCASANFEREVCSKKNKDGASVDCDKAGSDVTGKENIELRRMTWPAAYRGQACNPAQLAADKKRPLKERMCFPYFGTTKAPPIRKGLDNAKPGCIVIMPTGGIGDGKGPGGADSTGEKPLLPSVGCVVSAHNKATKANDASGEHLILAIADDGPYPDACGVSTFSGDLMNRTVYKPGNLPKAVERTNNKILRDNMFPESKNCVHSQLGMCEMQAWDELEVYCPNDDVRDK